MKTLLASLATAAALTMQPLAATAESINLDIPDGEAVVNVENIDAGVDYGYYDVYVENLTYETIYVGVHYYRWDGVWVTKGWYRLEPWQKKYILGYGDTKNRYIYFTAETADENYEWEGSRVITERVRGELEGFFKVDMGSYVKKWTQRFSY